MTEQDIDKHFNGWKVHQMLIGFPIGFLLENGISHRNYIESISALLVLLGVFLQNRFYFRGIRKMIKFIQQDLFNNPS